LYKFNKFNFFGIPLACFVLIVLALVTIVHFQTNQNISLVSLFSSSSQQQQQHKAMAEIKPTGTNNTSNSLASFSIYNNSSYGIRISYPADWQKTEYDNRFIKNFSDIVSFKPRVNSNGNNISQQSISAPPPPTVFIRVWNLSSDSSSLEQFTKARMESFKDLGTLVVNSNSTMIGGKAGYMVEYIVKAPPTLPPLNLKGLQVWTLNDSNKAYTITYTADPKDYSNYLAIAQMMINSFQIAK
jgi:PsbP